MTGWAGFRRLGLIMVLVLLVPAASAEAAEQSGPRQIIAGMRCGVCGMYPVFYRQWQSQIIFKDGVMVPFDGCRDMFRYLLEMARYDKGHHTEDLAEVWLRDFGTGRWFRGEEAVLVVGSSVTGPMGRELIPFPSRAAAADFIGRSGGRSITYSQVDMALINNLPGGAD